MKRYRERPSQWHVIVTLIALVYLSQFISWWFRTFSNPALPHNVSFWLGFIGAGIILAGVGWFLVRELIRQARLFKEWKEK